MGIAIWDTVAGKQIHHLADFDSFSGVQSLVFSPDGRLFAGAN